MINHTAYHVLGQLYTYQMPQGNRNFGIRFRPLRFYGNREIFQEIINEHLNLFFFFQIFFCTKETDYRIKEKLGTKLIKNKHF